MSDINAMHIRISPRDPRYLEASDGAPYIPIGLNLCFPRFVTETGEGLALLEEWITRLADNGGNYLRIWLGHSFFDIEPERAGEFDETHLKRIDAVLDRAASRGLRVKLTLDHFRFLQPDVPVAEIFPGAARFDKPAYHTSRGGPAADMDDFFRGAASREVYLRKIDLLARRYGEHPAMFGWELWNEINAVRGSGWEEWTARMLDELHVRFPERLAMQSLGSFDSPRSRDLYRPIMALPGNDIAQAHRYLDLGADLDICHGPVDLLAADAISELRALAPGKPALLAESGAVEPRHAAPFKLYEKDTDGIILHDILFAPFFAGAAGSGQCWHWDFYVAKQDLWHHFARFAEAVKEIDPPAECFEPVRWETSRLRVYALFGKRTVLLWCRDKNCDWRSELERDEKPKPVTAELLAGDGAVLPDGVARVYDPWDNRWSETPVAGGTLALPEFTRSIVVRIRRAG